MPFDDSGLAPAAFSSTCQLNTALPVFNVKNYGATGNGSTDDTVAIRNALGAAEAAGGGIVYLPAGNYAVDLQPGDPSEGSIFTIDTSNIVFIGDHNAAGQSTTYLDGYCQGLKNPATTWTDNSDGTIGRFSMFKIANAPTQTISGIQIRSLVINGDAGWTGNYTVGGVQSTGDGWDMTHKGIEIVDQGHISSVLVFNGTVENWRGEEIYDGGDSTGTVNIIRDNLVSSDADAVSCSANVTVAYCTIGGTAAGSNVYQGVENFACTGGRADDGGILDNHGWQQHRQSRQRHLPLRRSRHFGDRGKQHDREQPVRGPFRGSGLECYRQRQYLREQ